METEKGPGALLTGPSHCASLIHIFELREVRPDAVLWLTWGHRRMKRLWLPASLLLGVALLAQPQTATAASAGRIVGKVQNRVGEALFGAVITVLRAEGNGGTLSFTRSDRNGAYTLSNILPGVYFLQVSRDGFRPLTQSDIRVDAGRTTSLDFVLQEFIDLVSGDPDPRNWDVRSVMRGTLDRRLIFRQTPGSLGAFEETDPHVGRSATVSVLSSAGLSSENYNVSPNDGQAGIVSNFAFSEPVGDKGRAIFSGQLNSGYDSYWRVRNTYHYRPDTSRDLKFSVGYGRLNLNGPGLGIIGRPGDFFELDPAVRDSGAQIFGIGLEGQNRFLDTFAFDYGLDVSRVYYGATKSIISPYFQLVVTPGNSWVFRGAISSRRMSDANSITMPDGEVVNLMEPTFITKIDGEVRVSQFKHSEIAVGKTIAPDTSVEVAFYQDRMGGGGMPFLVTREDAYGRSSSLSQLRESQTGQRGLRIEANRKLLDFLSGSVAYVYGSGASLHYNEGGLSNDDLARNFLDYVGSSYYHMVTGRFDARLPTNTSISTVLRWHRGSTLTPIDLFADHADIFSRGVSFLVRQPIPVPDFLATTGRWEAMVDVRNLFNEGFTIIPTSDGRILIARSPRSLRFGLNLNLY
jgi:hypothetical protein